MATDTGNLRQVYEATAPLRPEYREPRHWFGLLTVPSSERKVYDRLVARRFVPYWPTFTKQIRMRGNRRRGITIGVMPGYMLLPLAIGDYSAAGEILGDGTVDKPGIPGVRDWLRYGNGNVARLSDHDIERIRQIEAALNSAEVCAARNIPFEVGQTVRIVDDLFAGWYGPVLEIDSERRIRLEVRVLGGAPLWVAASQIEAM